jgi:hypothetical protein
MRRGRTDTVSRHVSYDAQGAALSQEFVRTLLLLIGAAVAVGLVIAALVFSGGTRRSKRYRPGRPFAFAPVWFLSAPEHQARSAARPGRELMKSSGQVVPARGTGGASDRW